MPAFDPKTLGGLFDSDIGKLVRSKVLSALESTLDGPASPLDGEPARAAADSAAETVGEAADDAAEALVDVAEMAGEVLGSAASKAGHVAKSAAGKLGGAGRPALVVAGGIAGLTAASAAVSAIRRRSEQAGEEHELDGGNPHLTSDDGA